MAPAVPISSERPRASDSETCGGTAMFTLTVVWVVLAAIVALSNNGK
jgi:hypothetical protein